MHHLDAPVKPLARSPLTSRGELTRERILAAAAEVMFEQGVAATTIEDVRVAAHASSSQLYHYFEDKDALVRAVVERQAQTVVDRAESAWAQLDSIEALRRWRDFVLEREVSVDYRGGCRLGSLGSQLAEVDPELRGRIAAGFSRWEAAILRGLREMKRTGQLIPEADPEDLAIAALAALQGGLLLSQMHRDVRPLRVAIDTMIDHIESLTIAAAR